MVDEDGYRLIVWDGEGEAGRLGDDMVGWARYRRRKGGSRQQGVVSDD
jgi:hypothetical protein